jgi:NMD protein affecting ribosome stability and mRNA decay
VTDDDETENRIVDQKIVTADCGHETVQRFSRVPRMCNDCIMANDKLVAQRYAAAYPGED